jgi:hypothetical protein
MVMVMRGRRGCRPPPVVVCWEGVMMVTMVMRGKRRGRRGCRPPPVVVFWFAGVFMCVREREMRMDERQP